jgi:hypothetical protein
MDKKLKNIKSSVDCSFSFVRPYRSKDFVKPAPILDSSFTPFTHCIETNVHIYKYHVICIYCCCCDCIVCNAQTYCTFQPFFLEHVCIIICYFSYRLNCLLISIHYLRIIWNISCLHLYTFQDYHSSVWSHKIPFFYLLDDLY